MWFARHAIVKAPLLPTAARAVEAHAHLVSRPRRWISIVSPAEDDDTVPLKCSWLRRSADARLASVNPSPAALTVTSPGCTTPLGPEPLPPEGSSDEPPEAAQPSEGTASELPSSTAKA